MSPMHAGEGWLGGGTVLRGSDILAETDACRLTQPGEGKGQSGEGVFQGEGIPWAPEETDPDIIGLRLS